MIIFASESSLVAGQEAWLPGGVITFSYQVTHPREDMARLHRWIKSLYQKYHRYNKAVKVLADVLPKGKDFGFHMTRPTKGRYVDPEGEVYGEPSVRLYVFNVTSEQLMEIADSIRESFDQQSVVVEDRTEESKNQPIFVFREDEEGDSLEKQDLEEDESPRRELIAARITMQPRGSLIRSRL